MNLKNVIKPLSALLIIIAMNMIIPAIIALYYSENDVFFAFTIIIGTVIFIGFFILYLFRNRYTSELQPRDGFLFVSLSWVMASFVGALPFYITGAIPGFISAYFGTMSGFSTTGATILTNIEELPRSLLFWRSQTHWLGGMGIVVLTVAILPMLGIGGLQLIKAEAPGPTMDKLTPRIKGTAKILWLIYFGMTVVETLLLMLTGMNLFDAVTTTFATLATGGFSTYNSSIGHFDSPYIHSIITLFMILAGINYSLHYRLLIGNFKSVFRDSEIKVFLSIFFIVSGLITYDLYSNYYDSFFTAIQYATFQVASVLTTTGFATTDFSLWPPFSITLLFLLMFIGGCSGSTGGGIKVIRIITLVKMAMNEMKYLLHPRGIFRLRVNGSAIRKDIAYSIAAFIFIYILILLITTLIVATSGQDLLTSFTTALATVGNIGPGLGKVGPAYNYAFYPDYIQLFLSFAMLVGRLELYTVLVLFTPLFWKK
ncbi:MAG: TrkH family potassium uptake protein [Spirochaetes bacterium]|jgi:trk system potassium uptake protein TrkH|nr:TrkH family potassium uptake protein [Spirochaetota bacterium]